MYELRRVILSGNNLTEADLSPSLLKVARSGKLKINVNKPSRLDFCGSQATVTL
jgi:hypothetical protein